MAIPATPRTQGPDTIHLESRDVEVHGENWGTSVPFKAEDV